MIVDKPPWVSHGGSAIYAVDVHPGGGRLATCGNDNAARVWNLLPVLDAREEQRGEEAAPRLLAVLGEHSGPVNVVRFSRNGRWLASGSDDRVALVHELRAGGGGGGGLGGGGRTMLGQSEASVENWRVVLALRGHGNNVADLAWSPDDRYIATASLDGTVIVWDVRAALGGGGGGGGAGANAAPPQRAAMLTAHVGFVKGVAWDPMGTYLATQGDDGVRVWRTAAGGWAQVAHIEAPFAAASRTNFFLRLSWTPDGQYLVAANAYDRRVGRNTAPLFQRDVWRAAGAGAHSLVGHNAPVLSVRANPRLFSLPVAVRRGVREEEELAAMLAAAEEAADKGEGAAGAAAGGQDEPMVVEDAPPAATTSDQQQAGGGAAAAAAKAGKRAAAAVAAAAAAAAKGKGKGGGGGGDASADMDDDDDEATEDGGPAPAEEAEEEQEEEEPSGKKRSKAARGGGGGRRPGSRASRGSADASTEEEDEEPAAAGAGKGPTANNTQRAGGGSKSPAAPAPPPTAAAAAAPPSPPDDDVEVDAGAPTVVLAVTSADKQFSVWGCTRARPLVAAAGVHRLGVLDACWTPDGYTLITCSYDGTVSVSRFSRRELGLPLPDAEFRRMVESIYGDPRLRGRALAEDPAQLLAQRAAGAAGAGAGAGGAAGATNNALAARLGGGGGGSGAPFQQQQQQQQPRAVLLGAAPSGTGLMLPPPPPAQQPIVPYGGGAGMGMGPPGGAPAHGGAPGGGGGGGGAGPPGLAPPPHHPPGGPAFGVVAGSVQVLPDPPRRALLSVRIGARADPSLPPGAPPAALALEAGNEARDHRGAPAAEIACVCGGARLWTDAVRGQVVALAGSPRFAAAATRSGDLLIYTSGGRRALPPLALGAQAALMAADGAWRLAVLTTDARLRLYDVERALLMVETSAAPLLQPPRGALEAQGAPPPGGVAALRLCRATGAPILVLGNQHAHYYHQPLRCWLRVADDTFRASPYYSALPPVIAGGAGGGDGGGGGGEGGGGAPSDLAALQGGVLRRAEDVFGASLGGAPQLQLADGRAHLETLMASALAMGEPGQWRRWLRAYVGFLARHGDEGRLAELAGDLLGPPRWTPPLSSSAGVGGGGPGGAPRWAPTVLGLDKRRLLQTDVLPEANRVPGARRFVQATLDALRDAEAFVQAATAAELERRARQQEQQAGGGGGAGSAAATAAAAVPSMFADADPARGSAAPSMVAHQHQQQQTGRRR